ncbi:MAG: V-type ATP synthase subunit K [Candidatus Poseidoniales archaeon]|jgi:V/A-type H+-transporting ATPase subunit K|nr:V-type ATP synthase subunit K [Euryarchaeota archaeon]MBL6890511.1 V-type ATP synthase subunit K [Candidatus Poseidoniaceae archaeon]RJU81045.1 MAG: V-type ATP synthase subunit K [Candidatus Poseidoniales archaeon]|tara:strand:- start:472 stop:810 length:339 start_codon:yes stop_codon:yes gene_type:complete
MEVAKMNNNTLKMSLRTLIVLLVLTLVAQGVAAQDAATTDDDSNDINGDIGMIGVGLALGLAAIGAGFSQAAIGSAAVGMLAEDGSKFGVALIFTALPESIVILGALPLFLQ